MSFILVSDFRDFHFILYFRMSTHPGLNRLSRDEVCDKYLTLYDTHEGLKKAGDNDLRQIDKNMIKALKTQS